GGGRPHVRLSSIALPATANLPGRATTSRAGTRWRRRFCTGNRQAMRLRIATPTNGYGCRRAAAKQAQRETPGRSATGPVARGQQAGPTGGPTPPNQSPNQRMEWTSMIEAQAEVLLNYVGGQWVRSQSGSQG